MPEVNPAHYYYTTRGGERKLTPSGVRALAACPFCGVPRGSMCRRWEDDTHAGGVRKHNHAERIAAAQSGVWPVRSSESWQ